MSKPLTNTKVDEEEKVKERATMIATTCGMLGYTTKEMYEAFVYIMGHLDEFTKPKEQL